MMTAVPNLLDQLRAHFHCDTAAWRAMYDYAGEALPRPGNGLADLHVMLAHAVMRDDAAIEARNRQIEELGTAGRYPSGSYLPALARGFAAFERRDFAAAIEALAPLAGQNERIGGSRAQHDLIEFTLLKGVSRRRAPGRGRPPAERSPPGRIRRSDSGDRGGPVTHAGGARKIGAFG